MTDKEIKLLQECLQYVPDEDKRDQAIQAVYKAASDTISLKMLRKLVSSGPAQKDNGNIGKIQFSNKEIEQMPENVKRLLIINERVVNYRFYRGMYHIRYHRDGYSIEVASVNLETAKKKFLDALCAGPTGGKSKLPTLKEFGVTWLKYKEPVVKKITYDSYRDMLNATVYPVLGDMRIDEITRSDIQDFLNVLVNDGRNRTAEKCKQMLGAIFDLAVEDLGIKDPMTKVVLPHYEVKTGNAFTREQEKVIVDYCKAHPKTKGASGIGVLLYTGMRLGELRSMTYDDKFIYCISEKTRKGYADVQRKIPISPMMRKLLPYIDLENAANTCKETLRDVIKRLYPTRHVHELRYTFITRAKECGINTEVIMKIDGHESDQDCKASRVDRGYTDFPDEFLLKEMEKYDYEL
ncbi:MAG: site-specific integrase [Clostridia bacterium]|nr:site-specific integrase [Clostridia bacterium]